MTELPAAEFQADILVVDDNQANLRLLTDVLSSRNYRVHEALNGPEALRIAQSALPDLVLLDISMPGMDGFEVCTRLKADASTRDIPVIFISALSDIDDVVRGFEVGGVDYITKPFKFREVLARIASQLTLVRQRQEIEALRHQDRQTFESLNRMKNEFIRMATHDLRNPLNVILGYRSVLQRLTVAEEHRALMDEALQAIDDNVEKMRKLVTDMLDLAQMETSWQFKPAPVSLAGLLEKAVGNFHLIAEQKGITLALAPPTGDTTVIVDASAITRVVDNLIVNALKYTPPGERIAVRAKLRGQHAIIQVGDTGIGIPPEDVPRVFDAFYRVKRPDVPDVEGTGLGLSIVKAIVERHGGHIDVRSKVGTGSVFSVILPRGSRS